MRAAGENARARGQRHFGGGGGVGDKRRRMFSCHQQWKLPRRPRGGGVRTDLAPGVVTKADVLATSAAQIRVSMADFIVDREGGITVRLPAQFGRVTVVVDTYAKYDGRVWNQVR